MNYSDTMEDVQPGDTVMAEIAPGLPYKLKALHVSTIEGWSIIAADDGGTWLMRSETPCDIL